MNGFPYLDQALLRNSKDSSRRVWPFRMTQNFRAPTWRIEVVREVALANENTHGGPASVDGGFFTSGDGLEHRPENANS